MKNSYDKLKILHQSRFFSGKINLDEYKKILKDLCLIFPNEFQETLANLSPLLYELDNIEIHENGIRKYK